MCHIISNMKRESQATVSRSHNEWIGRPLPYNTLVSVLERAIPYNIQYHERGRWNAA